MRPRRAILKVASPEALLSIAEEWGLVEVDPEAPEELARTLYFTRRIPTHTLLQHLEEEEMREASRACGLLTSGDRAELENRLRVYIRTAGGDAPARRSAGRPANPLEGWKDMTDRPFVALDFETADRQRDSACALALIRVEAGEVVERRSRLVRPPRAKFEWTRIHGITWEMVKDEAPFREVWPELSPLLEGAAFVAAHNAGFDRSVLETCCEAAELDMPRLPFRCTVRLARRTWGLRRARLPDVCSLLDIPLQHHDATSDAEACARIVLAARARHEGQGPGT